MQGQPKELYVGSCLDDLNGLAVLSGTVLRKSVEALIHSSAALFRNAESYRLSGDEEQAYILSMKFLNLVAKIQDMPEYKEKEEYFENMLKMPRVSEAKQVIKDLTHSLEHRYRELLRMKSAAKYDTEDKPSELKQMRSEKYKQLHKKTVQLRQKAIQIHAHSQRRHTTRQSSERTHRAQEMAYLSDGSTACASRIHE